MLSLALIGCGGERGDGPPQVKYGRAECASCGMIVSSERYASAIVLPESHADRELIFDDINCMLEYESSKAVEPDAKRYVHDAIDSQWLVAEQAKFVRNPEVHTPMGSGLQAFVHPPSTMEALTYAQLRSVSSQAAEAGR